MNNQNQDQHDTVLSNKSTSKAQSVYDRIKEKILRNEFPPNEFISIGSLGEMMGGTGFTPTREAVQRLSDEQFLTLIPRKGIVIPEFDLKTIMDILELRFVIERYATVRALSKLEEKQIREAESLLMEMKNKSLSNFDVVRKDYSFHMKLIEPMGNKQFMRTLTLLYDHSIRFTVYFLTDKVKSDDAMVEHLNIVKAIRGGDPDDIEDAMISHQRVTRQLLLDSMLFTME